LFLHPTIKPSRTIDRPYNLPVSSTLHLGRPLLFSLLADRRQFAVLTHHGRRSAAKITRLSNFALNGAFVLLTSAVFTGNAAFAGGIEPSWMHRGDMVTMAVLVGVLGTRIARVSVAYFGHSLPISHERAVASMTLFCFLISAVRRVGPDECSE
jgi:hypothetical protein